MNFAFSGISASKNGFLHPNRSPRVGSQLAVPTGLALYKTRGAARKTALFFTIVLNASLMDASFR